MQRKFKKKIKKILSQTFGNIKCNQTTYKGKQLHCDTMIRGGVTHPIRTVFCYIHLKLTQLHAAS